MKNKTIEVFVYVGSVSNMKRTEKFRHHKVTVSNKKDQRVQLLNPEKRKLFSGKVKTQ